MPKAKLQSFTVWFENSQEYHHLKNEVFTQDSYYFETEQPRPVIIDAGAHLGLATLYFKKYYPSAEIIAIEPHPQTFKLLEKNVNENLLESVELHAVALAAQADKITLYSDSSDEHWDSTAGFIKGAWNQTQTSRELSVPAVPLSTYLDRPVDFLKMDIEGAEQAVLMAAGEQIKQIKHMIVEFHPVPDQSLPKLHEWLSDYGFKVTLWKDGKEVPLKRARGLVLIEARLITK